MLRMIAGVIVAVSDAFSARDAPMVKTEDLALLDCNHASIKLCNQLHTSEY